MRYRMSSHTLRQAVLYSTLSVVSTSSLASAQCGMAPAFRHASTAVWADPAERALLFVKGLNVNTDGTRRSYRVDDFWGKQTALNNLCNAMSDACAGLNAQQLAERRQLTQAAAAAGWPADLLKKTRISADIIPMKNGKPCPPVDGFQVSATALQKLRVGDVCDLANYVDALVTPALVLPRDPARTKPSEFTRRNAKVGDLVVAMRPDATAPVFAVVGDTGPADKLGEGSIALNGKLLGKGREPVNYDEVRGKGQYAGQGWTVPKAVVLIFPGTRDQADPFMTPDRIAAAARQRFAEWGGMERLQGCAQEYRP